MNGDMYKLFFCACKIFVYNIIKRTMKSIANLSCALVCFAFAACSHQSGKSSQSLKEGAICINLDHTEPLSASVLFDTIEYAPIDKHLAGYFFVEDEKNLVACGKDLLYLSSPVDTVYRIASGKGMEPAYVLDFGKYKAPSSFYAAIIKI